MPFRGFEGPAGTGKTRCLIEAVVDQIAQNPLGSHQRILALTFMHGSRRRLEERFSAIAALGRQHTCVTIDSFAGHVAQRWKTLCMQLDVEAGDFEQTCDSGGRLLEEDGVARWVAATHPVVVVDEAQELSPARLRVVKALAAHVALFVAADEFQCLDEEIDTGPFMEWFNTGQITTLRQIRRTSQQGLLDAAAALRDGRVLPLTKRD
jgi:superfamily I DNA/RNA helicase